MAQQNADWLGLKDRVCVVTGAGGGIGRAVALGMAEAGASVVLLDKDEERCRATAEVLRPIGARTLALACDIADPQSVAAAEHASRAIGPCDILVNNAGMLLPGSLATVPLEEWNLLLSVNLTGYLLCAQAFGKAMIERGRGAIVHTASIAGSNAQGFSGAYSVSKAGVLMLSRQLAVEWGPHGGTKQCYEPRSGANTDERELLSGSRRGGAESCRHSGRAHRHTRGYGRGSAVLGERPRRFREWAGDHCRRRFRAHADEPGPAPGI